MITGFEYAQKAIQIATAKKISYKDHDCQDWVEYIMRLLGIKNDNGTPFNWRGTNDMWRNALLWKGTKGECVERFGEIPTGAWLFKHRSDGGEKERGYNDNEGNAYHVGIYLGRLRPNTVLDSSEGGVAFRDSGKFNMVGLPYMIDYETIPTSYEPMETKPPEEVLKALETLTNYIKGV